MPDPKEAPIFVAGIDAHTAHVMITIVDERGNVVHGPVRICNTEPGRLGRKIDFSFRREVRFCSGQLPGGSSLAHGESRRVLLPPLHSEHNGIPTQGRGSSGSS
jgi:hypothetical protein